MTKKYHSSVPEKRRESLGVSVGNAVAAPAASHARRRRRPPEGAANVGDVVVLARDQLMEKERYVGILTQCWSVCKQLSQGLPRISGC